MNIFDRFNNRISKIRNVNSNFQNVDDDNDLYKDDTDGFIKADNNPLLSVVKEILDYIKGVFSK